jgi:hypothetical protein
MISRDDISAVKTTSTISLLAGIWLFILPWAYGAYATPNTCNSWIVVVLIMLFAAIRMWSPEAHGVSVVSLLTAFGRSHRRGSLGMQAT